MIVYILLLILTTIAAVPVRKPDALTMHGMTRQQLVNRICLCGIFLMLFGVAACRYYVGNDYGRYEEYFYNIWYGFVVPTEGGFNAAVKMMQYLFGKDAYLVFFAVFSFATVFLMLKAIYVLGSNFLFSFFLFMTFGYYFQSLNTVRYYIALAVAMYALSYVHRKEYLKFILVVLLASTFHKSVLVVIPVYLLANCRWKWWQTAILAVFGASAFLLDDIYLRIILYLYPTYRDTMYLEGGTSYINIARCILVLAFCLVFYRENWRTDKQLLLYFRLNVAALMLYVCGSFLPEVSRIGAYLTVTQIFLLPGVVGSIRNAKVKRAMYAMVVIFGLAYFAAFLYKAYGSLVKLLPYHTWLL